MVFTTVPRLHAAATYHLRLFLQSLLELIHDESPAENEDTSFSVEIKYVPGRANSTKNIII